jgi:hypothetical protein
MGEKKSGCGETQNPSAVMRKRSALGCLRWGRWVSGWGSGWGVDGEWMGREGGGV